jgi:hypothetical protein
MTITSIANLPRSIYIEPTSRCNEFCQQCPRTLLSREDDRDLSFDNFRYIVDQFPVLERVVLHGLGEPLLNKELPRMVRYLKDRGTYVLFNSNGIALTAKRGQALIDAGLDEYRVVNCPGYSSLTHPAHWHLLLLLLPPSLALLVQFLPLVRVARRSRPPLLSLARFHAHYSLLQVMLA